jgi:CelD/BcsL family acetyltransferase involved in cellulose biosynthesis
MVCVYQTISGQGADASLAVGGKSLELTRIESVSNLEPYFDAWRRLTEGAPMRSPEWLLSWWEVYAAPDDELCILLFHETQGDLVGLAPLYRRNVAKNVTFHILGGGDFITHHADWFCAAGWEAPVGIEVARYLLAFRPQWKRLLFESIDADAVAIRATVAHLAKSGCLGHQRQINSCWKIDLPTTWDDYLHSLSRSLRKRCRKLQRQFFDPEKIKVRQVMNEAELGKGFDVLLNLHAARWGTAKKPMGVFDEKFRTFHERVSRKLLAGNHLRLAWLECDGKQIAVEYQFVDDKTVYAYQAGVDLSMDKYSPGKLSMMAAIQFAIARGCESFDLLGGDEPYKANWRAVATDCHDLRVWREGIRGRLEWSLWYGYTCTVRRIKPLILEFGKKFYGNKKIIVQVYRNEFLAKLGNKCASLWVKFCKKLGFEL